MSTAIARGHSFRRAAGRALASWIRSRPTPRQRPVPSGTTRDPSGANDRCPPAAPAWPDPFSLARPIQPGPTHSAGPDPFSGRHRSSTAQTTDASRTDATSRSARGCTADYRAIHDPRRPPSFCEHTHLGPPAPRHHGVDPAHRMVRARVGTGRSTRPVRRDIRANWSGRSAPLSTASAKPRIPTASIPRPA